jgi:hypothetical protein
MHRVAFAVWKGQRLAYGLYNRSFDSRQGGNGFPKLEYTLQTSQVLPKCNVSQDGFATDFREKGNLT